MEQNEPSSIADLAILGRVIEEHRPRLLSMLRRRIDPSLKVKLDPEDILSETFLQARKRWPDFQKKELSNAYPWLYRIALDCLIEAWRRETRSRRDLRDEMPWPEQSSLQMAMGLIHSGTSPTAAAARNELQERLRTVMGLLKDRDREILQMRHEDELTHAEIGAVLGITENAATVRYVRALQRLRDLWDRLCPGSELST